MTMFLIIKRGLYYGPNNAGYTGIKDKAGRYTLNQVALHFPNMDSPNQDGMTYVAEAEAPDYAPRCAWDQKIAHERDRAEAQLSQFKVALWQIANPAGVQTRDDLIRIARDAMGVE